MFVLPRAGYVGTTVAFAAAAAAQQRPGAGLVVLLAAFLPVALLPQSPTCWPLSAVAPAMGVLSLGGAWPALAGRAANAWRRAALGCCGWVWLVLATPLANSTLYIKATQAHAAGTWTKSFSHAFHDILAPLAHQGALAPAPVWAAAALTLPWAVRGRAPGLDFARVAVWATALTLMTVIALEAAHGASHLIDARAVILGGIVSALVALAPTAPGALRRRRLATLARDLRSMEMP